MSSLRHRFRVVVDGQTHDLMTSARDLAAIESSEELGGAEMTWRLLHTACLRLDLPGIPHDLDKFVDLLDELEDLDGIPVGVSGPDPTPAAVSGGSP